jgi:hypothetical protein
VRLLATVFCNITAPFLSSTLVSTKAFEGCQKRFQHLYTLQKWDDNPNDHETVSKTPPTKCNASVLLMNPMRTYFHKTIFNLHLISQVMINGN